MDLLSILIVLVVVGVVLWAILTYIPMEPAIKTLIKVVAVIFVVVWLLRATGAFSYLKTVHTSVLTPVLK